ncbi:MAG: T9SS type A sorting domain-containing protein [Crocinitomicaceae bacterium]|nr:T9SS type A sorting domain-containing protein [Crocinitomicaceae bacterium]MBK8927944.1 T9SS type A sorting domain-containing protein [Crocinitomicaceae bacterium]
MKKMNYLTGAALMMCLSSVNSFSQCTDWENEYVLNKDSNPGSQNDFDFLGQGDQVAQTYLYSGEGVINAITVRGYVPGMFSYAEMRMRIYNVDANNRPTSAISSYYYFNYYDNPSNMQTVYIPQTSVSGNFAISIQVVGYNPLRTFACLTNETGDGSGEDLSSYRNGYSTGSWLSTLSGPHGDVDYYIEPLMTHTNDAEFEVDGGNCQAAGNVTFNNNSTISEDVMFNQASAVYTWNFGDASSSNLENPTHTYAPGAYTVTLTTTYENYDGTTCTDSYSQDISVGMTVAANVTNATCFGYEDGEVSGTVSNGNSPYIFWTSEGDNLTGYAAGTYTLYAEDDLGCTASVNFTVTENPEIVFGTPQVTSATCGNADGALLVSAAGGTGALEYSLDGGAYQSTGYFNGLTGGVHTVTVMDASSANCTAEMSFVIPEAAAPHITLYSVTNELCNGDASGEIVVVGTGGTGALEFSIDGGTTYQSSGTFTGLSAGTYTVLVQDDISCVNGISEIEVTQPDAIDFDLSAEDVLCFGGANGSIEVSNQIGGVGTFVYSLDATTYQSGSSFSGLAAGTYVVTVKDVNGCMESGNIVVEQPTALLVSNSHNNPVCNGYADGDITVTATGGSPDYTYDLIGDGNPAQSFNTFNGIQAGSYNIVVTDAHGCLANTSLTVTQPDPIAANIVPGSSTCLGSDGSIGVVSATGGTGSGYEFSFDGGSTWIGVPNNIPGLSAGLYDILVQDDANCVLGYMINVTNIGAPPVLTVNNHTDVNCHGGNDGSITVGTGVATDEYSIGFGFQSSGTFTGLTAGTYTVVVQSSAGCELQAGTITIIEPADFVIITTPVDALCNGSNDGEVDILASGGAGTISYSLDGTTFQSSSTIDGLGAGEYELVIQDALGCLGYSSFVIGEPTELELFTAHLDVTCNGASNGVIYAIADGGTPAYEYSLNAGPYSNSGVFSGLSGGTYTVYAQDDHNCTTTGVVQIHEPSAIVLNASVSDVSCAGGDNGVVDLSVTGGVAPYMFTWVLDDAIITTEDIFNLTEGTYNVTVTDANGCVENGSYSVDAPSNPLVVNGAVTNATGSTATDGEIDVTVTGGTAPYTYSWSNGSTSGDLTGLAPGVYTVEITDAAGCSVSNTFTVTFELEVGEGQDGYSISIYPNPASAYLNIQVTDASVEKITLIDLQGKVVYSDSTGDAQVQIGLDEFSTGIYFVNIHTDKGVTVEKVVITK